MAPSAARLYFLLKFSAVTERKTQTADRHLVPPRLLKSHEHRGSTESATGDHHKIRMIVDRLTEGFLKKSTLHNKNMKLHSSDVWRLTEAGLVGV